MRRRPAYSSVTSFLILAKQGAAAPFDTTFDIIFGFHFCLFQSKYNLEFNLKKNSSTIRQKKIIQIIKFNIKIQLLILLFVPIKIQFGIQFKTKIINNTKKKIFNNCNNSCDPNAIKKYYPFFPFFIILLFLNFQWIKNNWNSSQIIFVRIFIITLKIELPNMLCAIRCNI